MNMENYTDRMKGFIQSAQTLALTSGHQQVLTEHLLKVLLDDNEGLCAGLIARAGGDPKLVHSEVKRALDGQAEVQGGNSQLYISQDLAKIFAAAEKAAEKSGDSYVTVERMLLAMAIESGLSAAKHLKKGGVDAKKLNAAIEDIRKGRTADSASAEAAYDALKRHISQAFQTRLKRDAEKA